MLRSRAASGRPVAVLAGLATASLVAAALTVGGAHVAAAAQPAGAKVVLKDIAFKSAVTSIRTGQRVTWSWEDPYATHNIHSVGLPRFKGATARRTGAHTVRFARKGTYRYTCTLHPGMNGRIVVT